MIVAKSAARLAAAGLSNSTARGDGGEPHHERVQVFVTGIRMSGGGLARSPLPGASGCGPIHQNIRWKAVRAAWPVEKATASTEQQP